MSDEAVSVMVVDNTVINKEQSMPVEVVGNLNEEIIEELAMQVAAAAAAASEEVPDQTINDAIDDAMQAVDQNIGTSVVNSAAAEEVIEDERHTEITIGEPVAEKVIDSCVGTDNRRYYRVRWRATWEPEDELIDMYQNLIEDYWKVTVEEQNTLEHKNLISNLLENISQHHDDSEAVDVKPIITKDGATTTTGSVPTNDQSDETIGEAVINPLETLTVYKQVNSPEHKICDEPTILLNDNRPPPLLAASRKEVEHPHKCEECWRSYTTVRKLRDHQRKLHTNLGVYQCSECPKQFTTKRSLQMHMNRHTGIGPHSCPGCAKRYMTPLELGFHKRSCSNLVEKDFQCQECGKRFQTKTHLVFHLKIHLPPEEKPFKCQFCTRTFAYNHDCIHHMRLHIGEKPFKCTQCDKAFHRKSYLTEHMFIHTGVSRYQCETCQMYFKTQQMLQTHVKNVHILKKTDKSNKSSKNKNTNSTKNRSNSKGKYRCEECDKEFKFVKEFHFHRAVNHKESIIKNNKNKALANQAGGGGGGGEGEEVLTDFEPTMIYKCRHCDKTFKWLSVLKKHADTHKDKMMKKEQDGATSSSVVVEQLRDGESSNDKEANAGERENENTSEDVVGSMQTSNEDGNTTAAGFGNNADRSPPTMVTRRQNDQAEAEVTSMQIDDTDSPSASAAVIANTNDNTGAVREDVEVENEGLLPVGSGENAILKALSSAEGQLSIRHYHHEAKKDEDNVAAATADIPEPEIVCYVTHKGEVLATTSTGGNNDVEELNILACGHCLAGFTDEGELNRHVITEHSHLININSEQQQLSSGSVHAELVPISVGGVIEQQQQVTELSASAALQAEMLTHQHVTVEGEDGTAIHVLDGTEGMKIIQLAMEAKQELEALEERQKQMELLQQQQQQQGDVDMGS